MASLICSGSFNVTIEHSFEDYRPLLNNLPDALLDLPLKLGSGRRVKLFRSLLHYDFSNGASHFRLHELSVIIVTVRDVELTEILVVGPHRIGSVFSD